MLENKIKESNHILLIIDILLYAFKSGFRQKRRVKILRADIEGKGVKIMNEEERDKELKFVDECEALEDPEVFARKLETALREAFEANTDFTLGEAEDTGSDVFYIFWIREKRPESVFIPVEVQFDLEKGLMSLRYELSLGLTDIGDAKSVKELAGFFRGYAEDIEEREREILDLGFPLKDVHIDGIHHIYFYYQKDYSFDQVKELVKDANKLLESGIW
ncbi:MAG: hypothetical protein QW279_06370 [Candidatus Jordarchaeaceae archaeon]